MTTSTDKYLQQIKGRTNLMLAAQVATYATVASNYATHQKALVQIENSMNLVQGRLNEIDTEMKLGFESISSSLNKLESLLVTEINEVKWILCGIDDKLQQLINLVKFSRAKESKELVEQGLRAMIANCYDDAEKVFSKALEYNITDYYAHINLGLVYIQKNNFEMAKNHFEKGVNYSETDYTRDEANNPLPEQEVIKLKIFALELLARTYFLMKVYDQAYKEIKNAMDLRIQHYLPNIKCEYNLATYLALMGEKDEAIKHFVQICKKESQCFFISVTDENLIEIRRDLVNAYEILINKVLAEAEIYQQSITSSLQKLENEATKFLIKKIQTGLSEINNLIASNIYHDILQATEKMEKINLSFAEIKRYSKTYKSYTDKIYIVEDKLNRLNDELKNKKNEYMSIGQQDKKGNLEFNDLFAIDDFKRKKFFIEDTIAHFKNDMNKIKNKKESELKSIKIRFEDSLL